MLTIVTKEINDHQVVIGFDRPVIDSVATKLVAIASLEETSEHETYQAAKKEAIQKVGAAWSQVNAKKEALIKDAMTTGLESLLSETAEHQAYTVIKSEIDLSKEADIQRLAEAWKTVAETKRKLATAGNSQINATLIQTTEYTDWQAVKVEQKELLKAAGRTFLEKKKEIFKENAVYFTPKKGEEIVDAEEADVFTQELRDLPPQTLLLRNGEHIIDLRSAKYWTQDGDGVWSSGTIQAIGEDIPEGAIGDENLSAENRAEIQEQKEDDRVDSLTDDARREEFETRANSIKRQAALQKQELEIEGETSENALTQAQNWYHAAILVLWEKFGLTRHGEEYCQTWAGEDLWAQYWFSGE